MNTVAVRERPILFSGEMVRAILDGRKSQTRRVLGVQPLEILLPRDRRTKSFNAVTRVVDGRRAWFGLTHRDEKFDSLNRGVVFYCKYGEVGDRLWVREKCRLEWIEEDDVYWIRYAADDYLDEPPDVEGLTAWCERAKWAAGIEPGQEVTPWRLSIHMPRWASRLTLEITEVRVQRVQEIGAPDLDAEGITCRHCRNHGSRESGCTCRALYQALWGSLNGKRGYGWDANPWVWAISFRRVEP